MMQIIIFSSFVSAIVLGGLWFHDVWFPPEGRAERKRWSHSRMIENTTDQLQERLATEKAAALALHAEPKG